jgi:hypothetical protein
MPMSHSSLFSYKEIKRYQVTRKWRQVKRSKIEQVSEKRELENNNTYYTRRKSRTMRFLRFGGDGERAVVGTARIAL